MKQFLKSNLNQSGNTSFESLMEKYIAKNLLNNVNQGLNATKTLECMNNLLALINSYEPDGDGIISNSQKSNNPINHENEFLIVYINHTHLKYKLKKNPVRLRYTHGIDFEEPPLLPPMFQDLQKL